MNVGRSINVACAQNDMTNKDLAKAASISRTTISLLVKGKIKCRQSTLEALAKAFNLKVSEFIALGERHG